MRGLLRRATLTVDGRADGGLGEARGERGVARHVHTLFAHLHDAPHDHVLDERRVEVVALDERAQHVRGEVDGVDALELAVAASEGGTDRVDDDGGGHGGLQNWNVPAKLEWEGKTET